MRKIIIRMITNLIPVAKWRRMARAKLNAYRLSWVPRCFYKYKLYYFNDCPNFGDMLALDLLKYIKVPFCVQNAEYANFMCIGSIIDGFLKSYGGKETKQTLHIWGSGCMHNFTQHEEFCRPVSIYALRGKISLSQCESILHTKLDNVALGDPGLLIRRMFPNISHNKKYDVGIVCHMVDKDSPWIQNIKLKNLSHCFIDIQQSTKTFIEQVSQCRFILSSAMHGLICADSLSVPNRHIILSDKIGGGEHKFQDYYSVFSCPYSSPVDLREKIITDSDIDIMKQEYKISSDEIDVICDNLIQSFPKAFKR